MSEEIKPPIAKKEPKITKLHGLELKDDYFWLRFKENQEVINKYCGPRNRDDQASRGFSLQLVMLIKIS